MTAFVKWWFMLEVLGWVGFPIVAWLFPGFKDRGAGLARIAGLLLAAYPVWLVSHWAPFFKTPLIVFWLVVFAGVAFGFLLADWENWKRTFRHPGELILSEIVWTAVFLFLAFLRVHNPDIVGMSRWGGCEKFMDLNFVGGILNSARFPPGDNWLSGFPINYYYYGYFLCAVLIKLTGVLPHVGYNLMLITVYSLAIHGMWSLLRNLGVRWYWILIALFIGFFATNLKAADLAWSKGRIEPHEAMGTSRVIDLPQDHTINEYPIFTYMWGDLHGHLSGMALQVTVLQVCWGLILSFVRSVPNRQQLGGLVFLAISFGSLCVTNAWDIPAYAAATLFSLLSVTSLHRDAMRLFAAGVWLVFIGAILTGLNIVGIPFFFSFLLSAGVGGTLLFLSRSRPTMDLSGHLVLRLAVLFSPFAFLFIPFYRHYVPPTSGHNVLPGSLKSPVDLFLLIFGPHLLLLSLPLTAATGRSLRDLLRGTGKSEHSPVKLPAGRIGVLLVFLGLFGGGFFLIRFCGDFQTAQTPLLLALYLAAGTLWLLGEWLGESVDPHNERDGTVPISGRFIAFLLLLAVGLLFTCEFVAVKDFYGDSSLRFNTVFKFHLQAWLILALCIGFLCDRFTKTSLVFATTRGVVRRVLGAGGFLFQVAIVLGLIGYTGNGTWKLIRVLCSGFENTPTLDGLAYAFDPKRRGEMSPDDAKAILWLLDEQLFHWDPKRKVLEVPGNPYSIHGRVSVFSTVPTLVGWPNHEGIWNRGKPEALRAAIERDRDAKQIYRTPSFKKAKEMLDRYGITHVFWGTVERKEFGRSAERKFRKYMNVAKEFGQTVIFSGYKEIPISDENLMELPPKPLAGASALPSGDHPLNEPRGVRFGPDGLLYVCNSKSGTVDRYSPEKGFLLSFGSPGSTPNTGELSTEWSGIGSVFVDTEGTVFVADTWNHRIACFDTDGTYRKEYKAGLFGPRDVIVFNGTLVVSDTGNHRLVVFDLETGRVVKTVGSKGSDPGFFTEPVGLAVAGSSLYVADVGNGRIQVIGPNWRVRTTFDVLGWEDQVWTEPYLAVDGDSLWLTDSGSNRLERFSLRGKLLAIYGPECHPVGEIRKAKGIAIHDGRLAVSDFGNNRLLLCPVP